MISKRTIHVFYDILSSFSTLNKIQQLFECEYIFEPESYVSKMGGQRKSLADSYVSTLDFSNHEDVRKMLNVIELFFIENQENGFLRGDPSWKQFITLLERDGFVFEGSKIKPLDDINIPLDIISYTKDNNIPFVKKDWERALLQVEIDPEAAITATRSMLESTLKWILDDLGEEYEQTENLSQLYKKVANALNLSPDSHGEEVFKQILGSMNGIISGLGSLRNAYSSAHGKGKTYYKPSKRHAKFAINLSGTMCIFLIDTYLSKKEIKVN